MNFEKTVREWFNKYTGGCLLLPDGYWGRPGDNVHMLIGIVSYKNSIIMELTGNIILNLDWISSIDSNDNRMLIGPFDIMIFDFFSEKENLKDKIIYKKAIISFEKN